MISILEGIGKVHFNFSHIPAFDLSSIDRDWPSL